MIEGKTLSPRQIAEQAAKEDHEKGEPYRRFLSEGMDTTYRHTRFDLEQKKDRPKR